MQIYLLFYEISPKKENLWYSYKVWVAIIGMRQYSYIAYNWFGATLPGSIRLSSRVKPGTIFGGNMHFKDDRIFWLIRKKLKIPHATLFI